MDQNANDLKWGLSTPVKFIDKECGEVDVVGDGVFTYQITNQEVFNAEAHKSNMDADTYARGILLSLVIEEIGKFSGKLALSLSTLVRGDNILNKGNSKIANLGFMFTKIVVQNISVTEESAKKMQEVETTRIKSAITGREIAGANVDVEHPVESTTPVEGENASEGEKLPEKGSGVLGLIILAIVAAVLMTFLFK